MSREAAHARGVLKQPHVQTAQQEAHEMLATAALELKDAELTFFTARHRILAAVTAARLSACAVCGFAGLDISELEGIAGELEALLSAADLLDLPDAWRSEARALQRPAKIDDDEAAHAITWAMEVHIAAKLYVMGAA